MSMNSMLRAVLQQASESMVNGTTWAFCAVCGLTMMTATWAAMRDGHCWTMALSRTGIQMVPEASLRRSLRRNVDHP